MVALSAKAMDGHLAAFEPGTRRMVVETGGSNLLVSLWNTETGTPVAAEFFTGLQWFSDDTAHLLQASSLLHLAHVPVQIWVHSARVLPVPGAMYHSGDNASLIDMLYGPCPAGWYLHSDLLESEALIIQAQWHPLLPAGLQKLFSVTQVHSAAHIVAKKLLTEAQTEPTGLLVAGGSTCLLGLARAGTLLLLKALEMPHPDDLAYQMLHACKQWGIAPERVNWQVCGWVEKDAPILESVNRFFHIRFGHIAQAPEPDHLSPHFYAHHAL